VEVVRASYRPSSEMPVEFPWRGLCRQTRHDPVLCRAHAAGSRKCQPAGSRECTHSGHKASTDACVTLSVGVHLPHTLPGDLAPVHPGGRGPRVHYLAVITTGTEVEGYFVVWGIQAQPRRCLGTPRWDLPVTPSPTPSLAIPL
jgi:hypothetical protein